MNRGQLRAALYERLGVPEQTGDGMLNDVRLNGFINQALTDLSSESDWPWLVVDDSGLSFVDGVADQPTDYTKARELTVNGRRARFVPLAEFLDAQALGSPCCWTELGATIRLSPEPTTAPTTTLVYVRPEPNLADDPDSPLLPAQHHQVLLARAAYYANVRRNRENESIRDDNDYQLGVKKMRDATWGRTGPRRVRERGTTLWAVW